jgi:hypothetical protein
MIALLGADKRVEALALNPSTELVFDPDRVTRPGPPGARGRAVLGRPGDL